MYDRILVPTDGSAGSETVAAHAADLAVATGADLAAVYVVPESTSDVTISDEAAAREREAGEKALQAVAAVAEDRDVPVETELRQGTPDREIVAHADAVGADLLVMGTHGRQGLKRYVLGSVTEHVIREADQAVLAVKLDAPAVADAEDAERAARDALSAGDRELAGLRGDPSREGATWVVPAETADGRRVDVHVDAESGDARVADVD